MITFKQYLVAENWKSVLAGAALGVSSLTSPVDAAPAKAPTVQTNNLATLKSLSDSSVAAFKAFYPDTPQARELLYLTAVVESDGGKYKKQLGGGPALSYFQIEPATGKDVLRYLKSRPKTLNTLSQYAGVTNSIPTLEKDLNKLLLNNDKFAAGIARIKYGMIPEGIKQNDSKYLAEYWKKYYQAGGKKGLSADQALKKYLQYKK